MTYFPASTLKPLSRRFCAWGVGLLGLTLLTGCPQTQPTQPPAPSQAKASAKDNELHFDMRYYDSIEMTPRSPRTERELAIFIQLQRLRTAGPFRNKQGQIVPIPKQLNDSIYEQIGEGNPRRGFANDAELLADVHRKIDSLKVLEHIPLTPH